MKRFLFFVVTFMCVSTNMFADYCTPSASKPVGDDNEEKYLSKIIVTDRTNSTSMQVTDLQSESKISKILWWVTNNNSVYFNKTSGSVLNTTAGAQLSFSIEGNCASGSGSNVYIDYDKDEIFNQNINANGTGQGEMLINLTGGSNDDNSQLSSKVVTLPSSLSPGQYRVRFKVDNSSTDPCGGNSNLLAVVDFTINILVPSRTITFQVSPAETGTLSNYQSTSTGAITSTATANAGFEFVNWTLNGVEVTTSPTVTDNSEGNKTYIANFQKDSKLDRAGWTVTASSQEESGEGPGNGVASCIVDGNLDTFWHSKWEGGETGYPHWFMIDMKSSKSFEAFEYVSRGTGTNEDGENNGNIVNYQIYVSETEINPNSLPAAVATGTFSYNGSTSHKVELGKSVKGRYVMLYATGQSANGRVNASCSEFYLFSRSFAVTVSSSNAAMGSAYIGTEGTTSVDCSSDGTDTATLTAVPAAGYEFVSWTLNGEVVSTEAVYTTDFVTEARDYVANFQFKPVDPREVKVASNDAAKGYVTIVSPATSESSIVTGEMVTVKAVVNGNDNIFVNWTINGEEVSTEETFTYSGAAAVTLQANFSTQYLITINETSGGSLTVKKGATTLSSGDRVGAGTTLTITAKGSGSNWVKAIMVNGENVMTTSQAATYTATVKVATTTTITAIYGTPKVVLTYEYTGNGYIEVWSSDSYNEGDEETIPVTPAGYQYNMWDEVGETGVCIFVFPMNGASLISLTINDKEQDLDADLAEYGDIYIEDPSEPIHIVATFDGVGNGVESAEAAAINVYAVAGGIVVETAKPANVEVYTIAGVLVNAQIVSGSATIEMPQGVYIVKVADKVEKVIVK